MLQIILGLIGSPGVDGGEGKQGLQGPLGPQGKFLWKVKLLCVTNNELLPLKISNLTFHFFYVGEAGPIGPPGKQGVPGGLGLYWL